MKKIIFTLLALVGTMSMNAQIMEIYKDNVLVAKYKSSEANNVVFKEEEIEITGKAYATGPNCDVNWVQLWAGGPKFAEYNVGTTSATGYGGLYCWGSSIDKDSNVAYKDGTDALTGTDDTATNLWGNNWRMPTQAELEALLNTNNCDKEWTTVNGVNGFKFKGKGDYSSNSVFLPAAGYCDYGDVSDQGGRGFYWSSTPYDSDYAYHLYFNSGGLDVYSNFRRLYGYSVRAVLK